MKESVLFLRHIACLMDVMHFLLDAVGGGSEKVTLYFGPMNIHIPISRLAVNIDEIEMLLF